MPAQLTRRLALSNIAVALAAAALAGCSRAATTDTSSVATSEASELRLGYFPNVTHAAALIGLDQKFFDKELSGTKVIPTQFNAGPTEVNAILGGSLDAAFIGSGPAINAFSKSDGATVRLVAGAASGGAQLVTDASITSAADLAGKTIVTPQKANTQDVALKAWLAKNNLTGKVTVTNLENAQTLDAFKKGTVQAAWLPEPWSSRLVLEGGAKVLVDEASLWPDGQFPTTVLIVRTDYLKTHPQTVEKLISGEYKAIAWANANKTAAEASINAQLKTLTGKALSTATLDRALGNLTLTVDPIVSAFPQLVKDQVTAEIATTTPNLTGFADLTQLNAVLKSNGKSAIDAGTLASK